ncbi:SdrD B-like domain-containing protein [Alkalinema sp. FACHB-956]|uniref:SdrD B-like domain-containing protein n=1 Tax=Alkalinema sp. FACHB-956 TaxID=2692768 RepID=UPI0016832B03|nr:SdrD B-like domain-containing protein [Alkalinema sp. FACHB-956]MBD2325647.1 DUF11 domain-containing protein [Alkalinema sp. FACHB-956]
MRHFKISKLGKAGLGKASAIVGALGGLLLLSGLTAQPVVAEGSRTLYPATAPAAARRANLEWRTEFVGGLIRRRSLMKVFAQKDEYILLGSTAVGVGLGDIVLYNPGLVTGNVGNETLPASPSFSCLAQRSALSSTTMGQITNRTQELAGPQAITGSGNATGYVPCYYRAPQTGVYSVAFYGPDGVNSARDASAPGDIALANANNFSAQQNGSVAAWDITVRSSDTASIADLNGRAFTYYFALFTGGNGRPLNFPIYPVTTDGYQYRITLRGLDPLGFLLYGNQVGFWDSDGKTPLYHDMVGSDGNITNPDGGTKLAPPQYPLFVNPLDAQSLSYLDRYDPNGLVVGTGIPTVPIPPSMDSLQFTGSLSGNTSQVNTGGTFTFNSSIAGNYEIVISRDGVNFDPTHPQNRVLRGVMLSAGVQTVPWNGKDNNGTPFPIGANYPVRAKVHSGEYHFPLLDAENNFYGGPTFELLNGVHPLGSNTIAYFDDRGYVTANGTTVGTVGSVLCGGGAPNPAFSDPILGTDSSAALFRKFGAANGGNANVKCNGSFGDTKGVDTWTFFPSSAELATLNITAKITGTLYRDSDGNDQLGGSEAKLPANITVKLLDTNNNVLQTTTTDANGDYTFAGVVNGNYKIQVDTSDPDIPAGFVLGTPNNLAVTLSTSDITGQNFGFDLNPLGSQSKLLLVKRITAINNSTTSRRANGTIVDLTAFDDDSNTLDDNHPSWPSNSLKGAIDAGVMKNGSTIEYTIYFLSTGGLPATNVNLCDWIPNNTTYVPNSMSLTIGNTTTALTDIPDYSIDPARPDLKDRGEFFPAGAMLPSQFPVGTGKRLICPTVDDQGQPITGVDGAVVTNVVNDSLAAPNNQLPAGSFGFFRFSTKLR